MPKERGAARYNAVLDDQKVLDARALRKMGHTFQFIAELFNVSRATISAAIRGEGWSHLPGAIRSGQHDRISRAGSLSPTSKLDESDVRQIIRLARNGWTRKELARKFAVCEHTIMTITTARSWRHVSRGKALDSRRNCGGRGYLSWARLTEEQVAVIKALCAPRGAVGKLASHFKVSRSAVSAIKNDASWRHVKPATVPPSLLALMASDAPASIRLCGRRLKRTFGKIRAKLA